MKVLHLISGGDNGGAKTHLITLLKRLRKDASKNGVEVELLCIMHGNFTKEAEEAGIPIKIIEQKKRYSLKPILEIRNYIKSQNFDIVHCHGARANYIAIFIKNSLRLPFITTLHSDYKLDFSDNSLKQAIFMPINAIALRQFDNILAVTNSFKEMLIQRGFKQEKIKVIYNGINMNEELNIIPKEEFLKKYNIKYSNDDIYIGIVARLQLVKGLKEFLESAKSIINNNNFSNNKNIIFLIAGNGDMEQEIKDYIINNKLENNIKMLGFVKEIASFYNVLDINMLTSYSESFPYALLEGARQKKATIATSVGGIPEMIRDQKTGLLANSKSPKELEEKINYYLNNNSLINEFGESFYKDVNQNFSDKKMAEAHVEIYKNIKLN
ncbi:MAG: glycosyltransferase family 4 protein [bacterium]